MMSLSHNSFCLNLTKARFEQLIIFSSDLPENQIDDIGSRAVGKEYTSKIFVI